MSWYSDGEKFDEHDPDYCKWRCPTGGEHDCDTCDYGKEQTDETV